MNDITIEIEAAEANNGRKKAVRKMARAILEVRCETNSARPRPSRTCSATINTARSRVTPIECTIVESCTTFRKFCQPTNWGLLIASHLKNANTNDPTIGTAVNIRTKAKESAIIPQPKAFSRRAVRCRFGRLALTGWISAASTSPGPADVSVGFLRGELMTVPRQSTSPRQEPAFAAASRSA